MKKKIFITGANGFIGKNLFTQLNKTYQIIAPTHEKLDLLNNEAVTEFLRHHRFDTVIHCATENATRKYSTVPSTLLSRDIRMFLSLIRNNQYYSRMFYFGSGAEYDFVHFHPYMNEEYFDTFVPQDEYGLAKYICTQLSETVKNIYNLRLFGCFGPYEDWEVRFISNAICKTLFNLDITINQNVLFDYLYIEDLGRIVETFIESDHLPYKQYNICTGKSVDLKTLATLVKRISGKDVQIRINKKGMKTEYSGDNSRLLAHMGRFEFTSKEVAIEKLYHWYEKRKKTINKKLLLSDII